MKKVLGLVVTVTLLAWMLGCASSKYTGGKPGTGGGGGTNGTIAAGNWGFVTSGGRNTLYLGGYLTQSSANVTGNLFVVGGGYAIDSTTGSMAVTGSVSSGTLTLSGVLGSSTFTLTFSGLGSTSGAATLSGGSYTIVGGTGAGDTGTIDGTIVGSYDGTWSGPAAVTGGDSTVTVFITQAATPYTTGNKAGAFGLSSTSGTAGVTFVGINGCNITGTLDSTVSFVAGDIMFLKVDTIDAGNAQHFNYVGVTDPATVPTSVNGAYTYSTASSCMLQSTGTINMTLR